MKFIVFTLLLITITLSQNSPIKAAETGTTSGETTTSDESASTAASPSTLPAASPFKDPDLGFDTIKGTLPTSKYETTSWVEIGSQILNVLNTIVAFLAFFGLIISGTMFITAGGDPEKAEKAKKNIVWVVTGIAIYLVSLYILPVTRGIIEADFIKEIERQQALSEGLDTVTRFQAMMLRAMGIIQ